MTVCVGALNVTSSSTSLHPFLLASAAMRSTLTLAALASLASRVDTSAPGLTVRSLIDTSSDVQRRQQILW
jgi:hypothetical protein